MQENQAELPKLSFFCLKLVQEVMYWAMLSNHSIQISWKMESLHRRLRVGSRYQIRRIFGKIPNGLWLNIPHFGKLYCNSETNRKKSFIKVQNLQYRFLDWKWPPTPNFIQFGSVTRPLYLQQSNVLWKHSVVNHGLLRIAWSPLLVTLAISSCQACLPWSKVIMIKRFGDASHYYDNFNQ